MAQRGGKCIETQDQTSDIHSRQWQKIGREGHLSSQCCLQRSQELKERGRIVQSREKIELESIHKTCFDIKILFIEQEVTMHKDQVVSALRKVNSEKFSASSMTSCSRKKI
jgi:hypothetical protein